MSIPSIGLLPRRLLAAQAITPKAQSLSQGLFRFEGLADRFTARVAQSESIWRFLASKDSFYHFWSKIAAAVVSGLFLLASVYVKVKP